MQLKERILYKLRKIYSSFTGIDKSFQKGINQNSISKETYNRILAEAIKNKKPFMVSRFGNVELSWYLKYKILKSNKVNIYREYIRCQIDTVIKEKSIIDNLTFVPKSQEATEKYINLVSESIPKIDVLGSWLKQENSPYLKFNVNCKFIYLGFLEPYYYEKPWTKSLEGKKVLVIHPMKTSIESQYLKREKLFRNPDILPEFNLEVLQAPYFDDPQFGSWEKIMEFYKKEVLNYDFDVAILGCGSWGMPLAAYLKQLGKVAVHLGGSTQLLFGIIGSRWETQWPEFRDLNLVNEHWVRPLPEETPIWANNYEKQPYW